MRLIDADSFKRFLQALCKAGAPYEEVIQLLDKEPTAYDVKKVVEEIEIDRQVDFNYHIRTDYRFLINDIYDKTVQKVRKGGINE